MEKPQERCADLQGLGQTGLDDGGEDHEGITPGFGAGSAADLALDHDRADAAFCFVVVRIDPLRGQEDEQFPLMTQEPLGQGVAWMALVVVCTTASPAVRCACRATSDRSRAATA